MRGNSNYQNRSNFRISLDRYESTYAMNEWIFLFNHEQLFVELWRHNLLTDELDSIRVLTRALLVVSYADLAKSI